ncbi:MAG: polyphosphate polymerase domain-containing protein [Clostridiales bacterium]|nr:polyphosphate polymerase domain-containing protein [Clostridiales bacterium]
MDGRHELKYYINAMEYTLLRTKLRVIAKPDKNAVEDAGYTVSSLYFDNYADKAVTDKLSGLSRREKFRLRYYNGDTSFIRLEKKSKANHLAYKETALVTAGQCSALLAGDYHSIRHEDTPLLMELYTKMSYQNLRPRLIVEYHREAYVYGAGNVRVTFDSRVRTSNHVEGFLCAGHGAIPAAGSMVMEVKYNGFLPDVIRDLLRTGARNQTEFSKYVAGRLV